MYRDQQPTVSQNIKHHSTGAYALTYNTECLTTSSVAVLDVSRYCEILTYPNPDN